MQEAFDNCTILKSYECMNACILNHMNQAGISLSGSDIFFAGGGYPISYKKGSLTRIKSEGYEANFRFLDKYGIDYRFGRIAPTGDIMQKLLQEPYTITIRMISDCLTYDRVFSQTSGASHFINVLAYNQERKQFYIVDGDVPSAKTGCFAGWMDESDLLRGWALKGGEVLQMRLKIKFNQNDFSQQVINEANQQVQSAVENYLNGKRQLFGGVVTGEQAICCMVEQLGKCAGKYGFLEQTREANFRLKVDGYLGAKKFLLEKFREQNVAIADEYENIIQSWSKWCMLLLKSGMSSSKKKFELVKSRMKELVAYERKSLEGNLMS